eukprot:GFKZ01010120.1.p2 GENE.GFKZ01010120.1~~GFKZ01010120.1.p2  ORF type:complete len:320 (-),score=49.59 GFKZ01010120.1:1581-2540(-)
MADVVIGVKTGHEVAAKRLAKLRKSGWWAVGRRVPNLLVMSDEANERLGVVGVKEYAVGVLANGSTGEGGVDWPEGWFERSGWRGDKDKNLPMLHMMRWVFPGKRWYVLVDDDTYVFLENFARFLRREGGREGEPVYTGKVFYISKCGGFAKDGTLAANRSAEKGMFAHGGSGIVVNGVAMERVYPRIGECIREYSSCWAGDMQVGLCLRKTQVLVRKRGGKSGYERHFIPFGPSKALSDRRYVSRWKSLEEPVTFHKIDEEEEQLVSEFEKAAPEGVVRYSELREYLIGHGVVPCHTEHNKKVKWYTEEFMPAQLKRT